MTALKPQPTDRTSDFYSKLEGFNNFSELHQDQYYQVIPPDWFVVISDIRGSTQAIEEGRYKDVNTLGAATISVIQNTLGHDQFPFVFGGDGATALVQQEQIEKVKSELIGLKKMAETQFEMDLRVGVVPIDEIQKNTLKVEVAKYFINDKKSIALIRGGGLSWADAKIKEEPEKYGLDASHLAIDDIPGLSCRWQPIKSKRGQILTLLVLPRKEPNQALIAEILSGIDQIFQNDLEKLCPVNDQNLKYKSFLQCLKDEWNYNSKKWSSKFWYRIFAILICVLTFRFKSDIFIEGSSYKNSMASHSDYHKFDDVLRMVIDCTEAESNELQELLEKFYQKNQIFYGLHHSNHSLMTCLVESLQEGDHIHFIDGGDGGYAMAAKQMKAQMKLNS